eukprot:6334876-Lingulodinium_polyedra.AAC.1
MDAARWPQLCRGELAATACTMPPAGSSTPGELGPAGSFLHASCMGESFAGRRTRLRSRRRAWALAAGRLYWN